MGLMFVVVSDLLLMFGLSEAVVVVLTYSSLAVLESCGGCCTARKLCSDLSHIFIAV